VSRRALLAGTLAGVTVAAGCSTDALDPDPDDPTLTPSSSASATASEGTGESEAPGPGADPDDAALVTGVLGALAAAHRTARVNARAHPEVAPVLRRLADLHETHAAELGDLPRARGRVTAPGESPAQVRARVDRSESDLQRTLTDAATSAGSGALALTFASMAVGVAQARTTL
jgi:hypothetical protein